jgi:SAM-dependent methyltransferase
MTHPWMEFDSVDASGQADAHAEYLERQAGRLAPIRDAATARLGIGPGMAVLDAGCGVGEYAIALASRVLPDGRVAAIDASEALVDRARAAAGLGGATVDFRVADITDLPFPDSTFDVVRSERVFQHLDETQRMSAGVELLRVLRPGGIVQLLDPDHRQWAITAADRELTHRMVRSIVARGRTPESGIMNGGLLRDIGAIEVEMTAIPVVIDVVAAWFQALALEGWIDGLIRDGQCTPDRAEAFFDDLRERERTGVFSAVGVSYINTARKPG